MKGSRNLNSPVLTLNKNWQAIGTTTVKNAIVAISRDSARGLCAETFQLYAWEEWVGDENPPKVSHYIQAAGNKEIPAPEIIVLTRYDKVFMKTMQVGNRAVFRRDNFTCAYCKKKFQMDELSLDHVVPKASNGKTTWDNCVTACIKCNQKKGSKSLKDLGWILNPKPYKPKWSPVAHLSRDAILDDWKKFLNE